MANRRLAILGLVFTLLFLSFPALPAHGCGLSAEFADPCDLAGPDDSGNYSGGGPRACKRCVYGDDGITALCGNSSIYTSQWLEYYPCSIVTHCYYDGIQGWYCEKQCDGSLCYQV
jgi:hypothetical protein